MRGAGEHMQKNSATRIVRALPTVAVSASLAAGYAAPPAPEVGYAAVTQNVVQATAGFVPTGPATLPSDPVLSGPHPEIFYVQTKSGCTRRTSGRRGDWGDDPAANGTR